MRNFVLAVGLVAFLAITGVKGDWALAWEDNFDHGQPLSYRWNFENTCQDWGNRELQCYTNDRWQNIRQENGRLIIQARKEAWGNKGFTSARIYSKNSWTYGKFEMRARLPKGKHLWPAFWMMPTYSNYGEWPRSGEIDIMEYRGQRPNNVLGTLHFGGSREQHGQVGSPETSFPIDFSQDFHVFAVDWSPNKIMWMVDGRVYHEETLQRNFQPGFYSQNGQPFDKPFHMIINLAVGGSFFGDEPFDPSEANGWQKPTLEIDWVRKWEWK